MTINKIYLDLDGVLADFDSHYDLCLNGAEKDMTGGDKFWDVIHNAEDFWLRLPIMPGARALWNHLVATRVPIEILSAPSTSDTERAIRQKTEWVRQHFCEAIPLNFKHRRDKKLFAASDALLIDDFHKNVSEWREAGGHAILHRHTSMTISILQSLL